MPFALSLSRHWQALLAVVLVHALLLASLVFMPAPGGGHGQVLSVEVLVAAAGPSAPAPPAATPDVPATVPAARERPLVTESPSTPVMPAPPEAGAPVEASPAPAPAPSAEADGAGSAPAPAASAPGSGAGKVPSSAPASAEGQGLPPRLRPGTRRPPYPEGSRWDREAGRVTLRLKVRADGTVADATVLRSSGFPRLDRAARDASLRWRLDPARRGGESVEGSLDTTLEFRLED